MRDETNERPPADGQADDNNQKKWDSNPMKGSILPPKARPLTSRKFEATPQCQERGRYLAVGLTGCSECHSQHDWSKHDAPLLSGAEGGGQWMDMANPGHVVAPNISPDPEAGAGTWTDDQLARAIGEGIDHDSRALFPMMPYEDFRHMSDEDVASIVVWRRDRHFTAIPNCEI
jgi:mono/diheme cytochrome c family protein